MRGAAVRREDTDPLVAPGEGALLQHGRESCGAMAAEHQIRQLAAYVQQLAEELQMAAAAARAAAPLEGADFADAAGAAATEAATQAVGQMQGQKRGYAEAFQASYSYGCRYSSSCSTSPTLWRT